MNHFIGIVFLICVVLAGRSCLRDNTEQETRGAKIPPSAAHIEMGAATEQWHHWRSESIRHKSAGRDRESEACDRRAEIAYDKLTMYYHRIQTGDFSRIPTAAEEQAIRDSKAAEEQAIRDSKAADAYAIWVAKADADARAAGFSDWRAKSNAEEEIVRLASAAKLKSDADAAKAKAEADAAWLRVTSDPVALAAAFAAADAKYDAEVAARTAARAAAKAAK